MGIGKHQAIFCICDETGSWSLSFFFSQNEVQKILGEDLEIVAEAVAPRSKTNIIANESDAVEVQEINEWFSTNI